jgi:hypothetical protein
VTIESSGEWKEERLFVLRALERIDAEQRRQIDAENMLQQTVAVKAAKDIGAAHDKIRKLESEKSGLAIKNWVMAALIYGGGIALIELVKWALPMMMAGHK